jgi:hypothetical protein
MGYSPTESLGCFCIWISGIGYAVFQSDTWQTRRDVSNRKHEYLFSLRLSWIDGQQHTITNLISKILDDAIKLRLLSKKPKIFLNSTENRLSPWDVRRWDYGKDEVDKDKGFTPGEYIKNHFS